MITLKQQNNFNDDDLDKYAEILKKTNSYKQNNDPDTNKIKLSGGHKRNNIIKPLLMKKTIVKFKGNGLFRKYDSFRFFE